MNMKAKTSPDIELKFGLGGRYKMVAHKVKDGKIVSSRVAAEWFDNLITDTGMESLGAGAAYMHAYGCVVGTGNTPPTNSDTLLVTPLAVTTSVQVGDANTKQTTTTPYYVASKITYRFGTGVAAGNLTEVGLCNGSSSPTTSTPLFSRALIVDGTGTPTTITILSDEILDVTYEFRVYPPNGSVDVTGTFSMTIDGTPTSFGYTLRAAYMSGLSKTYGPWYVNLRTGQRISATGYNGNYNVLGGVSDVGALASVDSAPGTGTNSASWDSWSTAAYTANNRYVDCTYNLSVNAGNFTWNTLWFSVAPLAAFQMLLNTPVAKVNTKSFYITIRVAWARYTP